MKLARYRHGDDVALGLVADGIVAIARHLPEAPRDMIALIADWPVWRERVASLADRPADFTLDEVALLAPIARPGKILALGLNYADHVAETGLEQPQTQMWFSKATTAATGAFDPVALPRVSEQLDYEAELVVVIGRACRYADPTQATDAIFGYCVGNDVSVRDWQLRTSQYVLGKSFDTHAPHGPWIVTADELNPIGLDITCAVNGETRQSSNTSHMIFAPVDQVEYLSQAMTLEPGDLLFTGTPGGVAALMSPPCWLKAGDRLRTTIAGIGSMENEIIAD